MGCWCKKVFAVFMTVKASILMSVYFLCYKASLVSSEAFEIIRFQQTQYLFKELFRVVCDSVQSNLIVQLSLLSISHFVLPFTRHLYVQRILLGHSIDVATQHTAAVRWISLDTPPLATTGESEQHQWKTTQRATLCYVNAIIFSSSFSHKRNCI